MQDATKRRHKEHRREKMVGKNATRATWHAAVACHPLFRQDPGQVLMNIVAEGQRRARWRQSTRASTASHNNTPSPRN